MIEAAVIDQVLPESAQKVIETMFFAMPDTVSTDPSRPAGPIFGASLTFHGTPSGRFGLVASEPLARILTENFTGCEDASQLLPADVAGVMGELANMLCGAVLSELESGASFDLSAPEAVQAGAEEPGPDYSAGAPHVCRFEVSGGSLLFFLAFEEPA